MLNSNIYTLLKNKFFHLKTKTLKFNALIEIYIGKVIIMRWKDF